MYVTICELIQNPVNIRVKTKTLSYNFFSFSTIFVLIYLPTLENNAKHSHTHEELFNYPTSEV